MRHFHIEMNFTLLALTFTVMFTNIHSQPHWGPRSADDSDKSFQCAHDNASQKMNAQIAFLKDNIKHFRLATCGSLFIFVDYYSFSRHSYF